MPDFRFLVFVAAFGAVLGWVVIATVATAVRLILVELRS